jgi:hypothetical protein
MDPTSENNSEGTETATSSGNDAVTLVQAHRGRGRPKGSKNGGKPADQKVQSEKPNTAKADPAIVAANTALVRQTVVSVVGATDALVCRVVVRKAKKLNAPKEFVDEIWGDCGMTVKETEIIAECTTTIVSRHEMLMRYAPEVMLGCVLASYGVRVATVMRRLDGMAADLHAKAKSEAKPLA